MQRFTFVISLVAGFVFSAVCISAQAQAQPKGVAETGSQQLELNRGGATVVLEPYAPNILRVTLSLKREPAEAAPGYGIVGVPASAGWSASQTDQADVYNSARIVATVDKYLPPTHPPLQTEIDIRDVYKRQDGDFAFQRAVARLGLAGSCNRPCIPRRPAAQPDAVRIPGAVPEGTGAGQLRQRRAP